MNIQSSGSTTTLAQFREIHSEMDMFNVDLSVDFIQAQGINRTMEERADLIQQINSELDYIMRDDWVAQKMFDLYKDLEDTVDDVVNKNIHIYGGISPVATGFIEYENGSTKKLHLVRIGDATFVRHVEK